MPVIVLINLVLCMSIYTSIQTQEYDVLYIQLDELIQTVPLSILFTSKLALKYYEPCTPVSIGPNELLTTIYGPIRDEGWAVVSNITSTPFPFMVNCVNC